MAVRSREQDAELVAERHQFGLVGTTLLPRLAVAGGGEERGANTLRCTCSEQVEVRPFGGTHDDEVGRAVGQIVDARHGVDAEHGRAVEVRAEDPTGVPVREQVVERDEAELARVRRRTGDHHAAGFEEGAERCVGGCRTSAGRCRCRAVVAEFHQRVDGHGPTVGGDDERIHVGRHEVGPLRSGGTQAHQHGGDRVAVHRRFAPERAEQRLRREVVEHGVSVGRGDGDQPDGDIGHGLGQHTADADHDGHTELWVEREAADQLA